MFRFCARGSNFYRIKCIISLSGKKDYVAYELLDLQGNIYQISKVPDDKYEQEHLVLHITPLTSDGTHLLRTRLVLGPVQRLNDLPVVVQLVNARQDLSPSLSDNKYTFTICT